MKPTLRTDSRKIFKTLMLAINVMVQIYTKPSPSRTVKMLHVCSVGPLKILNKLNCNTCVIDLSKDYGISYTFNVNDLVNCKNFDYNPLIDKPFLKSYFESPLISPLPNTHLIIAES